MSDTIEAVESKPTRTIEEILMGYKDAKVVKQAPEVENKLNNLKVPDEARPLNPPSLPNKPTGLQIKVDEMENKSVSGEILNAGLVLTLIDTIIPSFIAFGINEYNRRKGVKKKVTESSLSLSAKQRKELEPLVDAVLKKMEITANPVWLLVVAMLGFYITNTTIQYLNTQNNGS